MIDPDTLKGLLVGGGPSLSVYFSLSDPPARARGRPASARLRTLIGRAEQALRRQGLAVDVCAEMVGALVEVADGLERDHHHDKGFGYFASPGRSRMMSLPVAVPELLDVGPSYFLKPLLGLVARDRRFHVLALSTDDVRLYAATPYSWEELPLDIVPDFDEGLQEDCNEADLLLADLKRVAAATRHTLGADASPVLLIAEAKLGAQMQRLRQIPTLHSELLALDPFALTPEELHARAVAAMTPVLDAEPEAVVARVRAATGRAAAKVGFAVGEILARAKEGRVEAVVVAEDRAVRANGEAEPAAESARASTGPDLLNEAAVETLRHGGRAYALPSDRLPEGSAAVAVYRSG